MFDKLRVPFFIIANILLILAFGIEIGSKFYLGTKEVDLPSPGLGILYLALIDWLLLYTVLLMGTSLIIPDRIHGRIQGVATFIVGLLTLLGAIAAIIAAFALLMLMVSLLLAVPFGTIAYFAGFANFKVGAAASTLTFIMTCKIAFVVCLILAQQRFLQNKGLVFLVLTSLLATVLLGFLHGFVPRFLAYITDDIGALISGVLAALWALFFLIGSIPSIFKALRLDRAFK